MSARDRPGARHNGGPPLDPPPVTTSPRCKYCRHWRPPPEREQQAYEFFQLGLSRRRVRRPAGACDRVLLAPGKPLSFSATSGEFACLNFEASPSPPSRPSGSAFVTISEGGRIVWQGPEDQIPAQFRQDELDLPPPERGADQ